MPNSNYSCHRGFVRIDGRRVHYRRWGEGPVILMLHGSPQSSRAVEKLSVFLADKGFCTIAPDSPGYGLSTPLANAIGAEVQDFARALKKFTDALELTAFGLYGFHTGASFAATYAVLYPEQVTALAFDGNPAWTDAERNTILQGYLPPFTPDWSGSHMTWLWSRIEEQVVFFPWNIAEDATRMDYDMSTTEHLHGNVMDFLESGDPYRHGYRASFIFDANTWIPQLKVPCLAAAMDFDPLAEHYNRPAWKTCNTQTFATMAEMYEGFANHFRQHPGDTAPATLPLFPDDAGICSGWVGPAGKALAWEGKLPTSDDEETLVLIPEAGGSTRPFRHCLFAASHTQSAIAIELPGHGNSDRRTDAEAPATVPAIGKEIAEACDALGIKRYRVIGKHLGGQIAAWLVNEGYATRGGSIGINRIDAQLADDWAEHYAPELAPEWDGAHLVRAFRIARWEQVFYPWYKRERNHARKPIGLMDPELTHQRAVDLLRAGKTWQAAVNAETTYAVETSISLGDRFQFYALESDPRSTEQQCQSLQVKYLSSDPYSWITVFNED